MESPGHSPLGPIKDRPWMTSVLSTFPCYHISNIMVRISQLPSLTWSLMCSPSYVATGYAERLSVSPGGPMCVGKFRDVPGGTKSLLVS